MSSSRSGAREGTRQREFSAGGVVVRGEEVVVIVPTRRAADGSRVLALPKGHPDPGESRGRGRRARGSRGDGRRRRAGARAGGDAATGTAATGRTIGKSVAFFLFTYVEGDIEDHDDEVEEARWMGARGGATALSYEASARW